MSESNIFWNNVPKVTYRRNQRTCYMEWLFLFSIWQTFQEFDMQQHYLIF